MIKYDIKRLVKKYKDDSKKMVEISEQINKITAK